MKYKIAMLLFVFWVILWVFFDIRELFLKGNLNDYCALLHKTLDDKRAYVTGERFYEFLKFCNGRLPDSASYRWVKTDKTELARRRSTYYLYPHIEKEDARFILVYDDGDVSKDGYEVFASLDNGRYILKVKGGRGNWKY